MRNNKFLKNTAILFLAMAITKIVGAVFKIPLANVLGGTGMGYFSTAYGLYSPVFALTVAGIPTVVMRLTAQNIAVGRAQNALKIKQTALLLFGAVGLLGTAVILLLSGYFAEYIACSPDSRIAVAMISPAVVFCSVASVIRGYYEGHSDVIPTAAANVTEAVSRAAIGLLLSYGVIYAAKHCYDNCIPFFGRAFSDYESAYSAALPFAAAAAILAVALSELCGLLALIIQDKRHRHSLNTPDTLPLDRKRSIIRTLIREIIPISASALVMNCFSFADLLTVTRTLNDSAMLNSAYFGREFYDVIRSGVPFSGLANFMYGSYSGIAMSLFMLIPSFAAMSEKTSVPEIAAAYERKDTEALRSKTRLLIKSTALIGFPACFGAAALAEPILTLLYRSRLPEVSVCLDSFIVLCLGGMFLILTSVISGIFQAIGKSYIPLWIMCGAVAVKFAANPVLLGIKEINITGAAVSTILSYITAFIISIAVLKKYIPDFGILGVLWRPMLCGVMCAVGARLAYTGLESSVSHIFATLISVAAGGFIYVLSLIISGGFRTSRLIKQEKVKKSVKGLEKKLKIG